LAGRLPLPPGLPCAAVDNDATAMAAGVTDRLWSMEEIAELIEAAAPKPGRPATYKNREPLAAR
jgi:hypothetical protein